MLLIGLLTLALLIWLPFSIKQNSDRVEREKWLAAVVPCEERTATTVEVCVKDR